MPPAQLRPGDPARARGGRPAGAREGPGVPLPDRRGVHRGARERAPRADARRSCARRCPSRSPSSARAGGCGCSCCWRWSAIAVGAWFLLAGNQVERAERRRPRRQRGGRQLHDEGLEVAFVNRSHDDVPRDEVISEEPAAGEEVREGTTITLTVSAGAGTAAVPAVERRVARGRRAGADRRRLQGRACEEAFSDSVPDGDVISRLARGRPPGDEGPHGDADGVQGRRGRRRCRSSPACSATRPSSSCTSLGLTADVTEEESSQPPGTVTEQDPAAGTSVEKGAGGEADRGQGAPRDPGRHDRQPDGRGGHADARGGRLQGRDRRAPRTRRSPGA